MESKGFGAYLREWRKAIGLSQTELADLANNVCTHQYISLLEREAMRGEYTTHPSEEIVAGLAKGLGLPLDTMRRAAGYADLRAEESEDLKLLCSLWAELSPTRQADLLAITQTLYRRQQQAMNNSSIPVPEKPTPTDGPEIGGRGHRISPGVTPEQASAIISNSKTRPKETQDNDDQKGERVPHRIDAKRSVG